MNTDIRSSANNVNSNAKRGFAVMFRDKKLGDAAEAALLLKGYETDPDSSIAICDEESTGSAEISSAEWLIVLYRSDDYPASDVHAELQKRLGSRYTALSCPYLLADLYEAAECALSPNTSGTAECDCTNDGGVICCGLTVTYRGESVTLTEREYKLFEYLFKRRGTVVSRDELNANVWGSAAPGNTNVAEVYISYLRRKLRPLFGDGVIISVRGKGYILSL